MELLSAAWAPTIADTYGNTIKHYFRFYDEKQPRLGD